jgi:cyclophilin family peptidyl-prolyl cis-trans isomerase
MKKARLLPSLLALASLPAPAFAQPAAPAAPPSPGEIVAAAPAAEWIDISSDDLLVMTLANDAQGKPRRVIIQLAPAPLAQGWVGNIRTLAKAHWYDGISVVRVQDNYVTQWGDPDGEDATKAKKLPAGLRTIPQSDYVVHSPALVEQLTEDFRRTKLMFAGHALERAIKAGPREMQSSRRNPAGNPDPYSMISGFLSGWPVGADLQDIWPVHCYGYVGVGRGMSPDTGTGAELYAVIGHAPRHLDRNIAVVGRVVEGIEYLSSLPRGTGPLGFYETAGERTAILSIRLASSLPTAEQPKFQFLATGSKAFVAYADARANRRDPFFIVPAGGADICNVPVPVRRKP